MTKLKKLLKIEANKGGYIDDKGPYDDLLIKLAEKLDFDNNKLLHSYFKALYESDAIMINDNIKQGEFKYIIIPDLKGIISNCEFEREALELYSDGYMVRYEFLDNSIMLIYEGYAYEN